MVTQQEREFAEKQLYPLFNDLGLMAEAYKLSSVSAAADSNMRLDDLALKPHLMSVEVGWAISSCFDHLVTVRNLAVKDLLPNIATHTLLRAAMEHASLAIWHLDPDEAEERRHRVLLQGARSASLVEKALDIAAAKTKISFADRLIKINKIAHQNGVKAITAKEGRESNIKARVFAAGALLQRQSSGSKEVNVVGALWAATSGIAHSNTPFGLMMLNRKALTQDHESESTTFEMEITQVELLRLFQPSIHLLEVALQLDKYRRGADIDKYPTFSK